VFVAEALPQIPLGELTTLPRPLRRGLLHGKGKGNEKEKKGGKRVKKKMKGR